MAVQPASVLECSVPPANDHKLSMLFNIISSYSTEELARSLKPDITTRSPQEFKCQPGPRKQPIPAVPRWISGSTARYFSQPAI